MGPEPEAMEASLMQAYAPRDPLQEYLRGTITLRKLRVMVEGIALTPETPVGRVVVGPWGNVERIMRRQLWELQKILASYINAHRSPGEVAIEPEPMDEPPLTYYQREALKTHQKAERAVNDAYEQNLLAAINIQEQ